jgi:hypothetical protein
MITAVNSDIDIDIPLFVRVLADIPIDVQVLFSETKGQLGRALAFADCPFLEKCGVKYL